MGLLHSPVGLPSSVEHAALFREVAKAWCPNIFNFIQTSPLAFRFCFFRDRFRSTGR